MTTIAEQIAARFGDDGTNFWAAPLPGEAGQEHLEGFDDTHDGQIRIDAVAAALSVAGSPDVDEAREAKRFTFEDGSTLVVGVGCWDLGFPGCFCMRGAGHEDGCDEAGRA